MTTDNTDELRDAIGFILDRHAHAVIEAKDSRNTPHETIKWNKGEYVLKIEKLFVQDREKAVLEAKLKQAEDDKWAITHATVREAKQLLNGRIKDLKVALQQELSTLDKERMKC